MLSSTIRAGLMTGLCIVTSLVISSGISAAELPLGAPTQGTLAQSANADYTLTLDAPGRLTIVFTGWLSTYNWGMDIDRLYLYNAAGDPVGWESFGSENDPYIAHMMQTNDSYTVNVGQAGVYTLRLHSGSNYQWPEGVTAQSYSITVTLDEANDVHEDNSTLETATDIAASTPVTAHQWRPTPTMSVYNDEDYYRIVLPSPGILAINLDGWVSTYNWGANYDRLYIYNSEGIPFNSSGAEEYFGWMMGDPGQTIANLAAGGVYYIRLHAGDGISTEPYTIQYTLQSVADVQEPNDDIETAAPIQSGAEITAYQWRSLAQGPQVRGDEDWYSFTVGAAGAATLTMTGWVSTYNWGTDYDRGYLYRLNGSEEPEEIMNQHMLGSDFSREFQLEPGQYAIRLHSGNGVSTEPYTLSMVYPEIPVSVTTAAPESFSLGQPYPNPFNPETTIGFSIPGQSHVTISIYDISGQRVRTLADGLYSQGAHSEIWNGTDDSGKNLAAGVYFVRLNAGEFQSVRKMVMVK